MTRKSREKLEEELDWLSNRISDRIWTVNVGILAFSLGFVLKAASDDNQGFIYPNDVLAPITLSLLSLCADIIQYICGLAQNVYVDKKMGDKVEIEYDVKELPYRSFRFVAFYSKTALCFVGVIWLVGVCIFRIVHANR